MRAFHLRVPDRPLRLGAVRHALEAGRVGDGDGLDHREQRDLLRLAEQRHALLRGMDRQVRSVTGDEHMHDPVLHAPATLARHGRTRIPPAAAERRMASSTSMPARPSANVGTGIARVGRGAVDARAERFAQPGVRAELEVRVAVARIVARVRDARAGARRRERAAPGDRRGRSTRPRRSSPRACRRCRRRRSRRRPAASTRPRSAAARLRPRSPA